MGVYKHREQVPKQHRFEHHTTEYEGRDVWEEFERARIDHFDSESYKNTFRKTERVWKTHMSTRGRHHALARPADVNIWCAGLASDRTLETVYKEYWVRLEEFYSWLQSHREHPHVYQPVLMAAANYEIPRAIWWVKLQCDPAALSGALDE